MAIRGWNHLSKAGNAKAPMTKNGIWRSSGTDDRAGMIMAQVMVKANAKYSTNMRGVYSRFCGFLCTTFQVRVTAKAVAAQMLEKIEAIPELKEEGKIQLPESLEEFLKFRPLALKSLAQMLHEPLGAIRASDLEVAQGIAKQLEGFIQEEPFLDFTED